MTPPRQAPVEAFAPPPPPPPPDRAITNRREAEAEIARIIATVEALPLDDETLGRGDGLSSAEARVSDLRDDPIEAEFEALEHVEPEMAGDPEIEPEPQPEIEPEPDITPEPAPEIEPEPQPEYEPDPQPEYDPQPAPQPDMPPSMPAASDAAAERVMARMAEEIAGDGEGAEAQADGPDAEDAAPAQPAPAPAPLAAFDMPDGMDLGFTLTRQTMAVQPEPRPEPEPEPETRSFSLDLPEGQPVGYAFTSVMVGRLPEGEPAAAADASLEAQAGTAPEAVEADDAAGENEAGMAAIAAEMLAEEDISRDEAPSAAEAVATGTADVDTPEAVASHEVTSETPEEARVAEIVERAVSGAGQDAPPHPAETPAEASGAVGEVEAGHREKLAPITDEHAPADALLDGSDPLTGEDDFSPKDLAADLHPAVEKPAPRADDGAWAFLAAFGAGAVAATVGGIGVFDNLEQILSERPMSADVAAFVGGSFVAITAGWQLASIWLAKLKQNASG